MVPDYFLSIGDLCKSRLQPNSSFSPSHRMNDSSGRQEPVFLAISATGITGDSVPRPAMTWITAVTHSRNQCRHLLPETRSVVKDRRRYAQPSSLLDGWPELTARLIRCASASNSNSNIIRNRRAFVCICFFGPLRPFAFECQSSSGLPRI